MPGSSPGNEAVTFVTLRLSHAKNSRNRRPLSRTGRCLGLTLANISMSASLPIPTATTDSLRDAQSARMRSTASSYTLRFPLGKPSLITTRIGW